MSAGFDYGIVFLLQMEGGYAEDLGDGAGETHWGVTKRSYPDLDIRALTVDQARAIYQRDFYEALHLDLLPAPLAVAMLDTAANHGPATAVKLLQEALGVPVDGTIGPVTAAAAKAQPKALKALCVARLLRYSQNAQFARFGRAWANRVLDCYLYARGVPS